MDHLITRDDLFKHHVETPSNLPATEPGVYQALVLDGLSVITALLFGFGYRMYLAGSFSPWVLITLMLAFGVMTGLHAIMAANKVRRLLVILAEVVAIGFFFFNFDRVFLLTATALLYIFLAAGYLQTRQELFYSTTIRFFKHTHGILGKFITGTLLFMVLLYVPELTPGATFVPQATFSQFFNWSAHVVEIMYPSLPLTGSFGDVAQNVAETQLKENPEFAQLSPQAQSSTVASNADALITNFSKSLGVAIEASDTVPSVMYEFIQKTLTGWRIRFASAFLLGWTVLIFFVLRSVGILFVFISQIVLGFVYEILLATKLITIKQEPTTREIITYR